MYACGLHMLPLMFKVIMLIKIKAGLANCKDLADEEMSDIIIAAHCITGCDHIPGQYGHGKIQRMNKLRTDPEARELL